MAISDTQKLDALYKKFGFGVAKTDTASNKSPSNEAIASPLLVRGDKVWNESDLIPATPPSETTVQVKVRTDAGDGAVEAAADATATPNRTWITGVINWIPAQFGATYAVKVYADVPGAENPQTTGTLLSPDGSGNNDAYLFDYTSGVLNFSDTNIPSAVTGKKIYVVGYTYNGSIGLKNNSGLGGGLTSTNGSISTTTTNGDLTLSGNGTGDVVLNSDTQVNGALTSTGTITAPTLNGDVTSTGTSSFNNITVSGSTSVNTLTATGDSSLEDATVSGTLSVAGATTLADVTAEDGTFATITVTGSSSLQGNTTVGTVDTHVDLTVNGNIVATGKATVDGNVTINGNLTVSGLQTVIETEVLKVADNIITLNNGIGDETSPTESAGLEVDRGAEGLRTIIQWNETTDVVEVWQGTQLREVATKADLTSASSDLTAELNLTQASAGINTDGTFTAFTGTYTTDTTLKAGIVTLDTNLARVETGVGVWGDLTTTSKVVVGAINELAAELGNTTLSTVATTITTAINEVDLHANNIYTALGVVTDADTVGFSGLNFVPSNATIKSAIEALDTQLNATSNQVDGNIGDLDDLTTTDKTTLVAAINEVDLHANSIYGVMGVTADATVSGFTGLNYVGADATLKAAVEALDAQLFTTAGQVDGNIGDLETLSTTFKTTLVGAINEVDTHANNLYTVLGVTADATVSDFTELNYIADNSTLKAAVEALDAQLFTTAGQVDGNIGDLETLATTTKSTLVGAINEVDLHANNLYTALGITQDGTATDFTGANYVTSSVTVTAAITALDAQLKTTTDQVDGNIGTLDDLTTTTKVTLVAAINEVDAHANSLYTVLGVTQDATVSGFASLNYVANDATLKVAVESLDTQLKTTTDQVDGKIGTLDDLTTTTKVTLVAAINEVDAHANNLYTVLGVAADTTVTGFADLNYVTADATLKAAVEALDAQLFATAGQVDGNIGDLETLATSDKSTIVAAINSEVARATGVEGSLASLTTTAKTTLVAAINELDADLSSEVSRAQSAETTLTNNLTTEVTNRTNADNALGVRIDNVNTAAGITGDAYVANGATNFIAAATSLNDADVKLDAALKTNQTDLASTTNTKGSALVGYKGYTEADNNIVNPTIEIAAGTLEEAINDIAASVNLRIHEIDSRYVKGEVAAQDASDTYTIAHNLDTNFVDVSVQVYDTDLLVWRFDLVVVEVIDVNTVKISLASGVSSQIRYVIHGY